MNLVILENTANNLDDFKNLSEALQFHGFFSIYDHQIEKVHIEQCYKKSQEFFNLDLDIKNKYAFPEIGGARGYTPFGKETALGEDVPDLKEFWHHGPVLDNFFDHRVYDNIKIKEVDDYIIQNNLDREVLEQTEIQIKYAGYIDKERVTADKLNRLEGVRIPENFDYSKLKSLSYEALEKLRAVKPVTVSQASRISGVSPNDISVLLVYMGR